MCFWTIASWTIAPSLYAEDNPTHTPPVITDTSADPVPLSMGTVLRVNDDAVTSTEVIAPLRKQLREWAAKLNSQQFLLKAQPAIAESTAFSVRNLLLYQYALRHLQKNENFEMAIEAEMAEKRKALLAEYDGSAARAQAELARLGSSIEDQLKAIKRALIVQIYQETYFIPFLEITRVQMLRYYRAHLDEKYYQKPSIQFQLIDIQAQKFLPRDNSAQSDEQQWASAQATAAQAAQTAWQKIQSGADFAGVAKAFSHGYRKDSGGLWRPLNPDSLQEQYKPVATALAKVNIGQCAGIVEGENRYFIAKLIDQEPAKITPFCEAQSEIDAILRQQRWEKYSNKLIAELLETATLGSLEQFMHDVSLAAYEQMEATVQN